MPFNQSNPFSDPFYTGYLGIDPIPYGRIAPGWDAISPTARDAWDRAMQELANNRAWGGPAPNSMTVTGLGREPGHDKYSPKSGHAADRVGGPTAIDYRTTGGPAGAAGQMSPAERAAAIDALSRAGFPNIDDDIAHGHVDMGNLFGGPSTNFHRKSRGGLFGEENAIVQAALDRHRAGPLYGTMPNWDDLGVTGPKDAIPTARPDPSAVQPTPAVESYPAAPATSMMEYGLGIQPSPDMAIAAMDRAAGVDEAGMIGAFGPAPGPHSYDEIMQQAAAAPASGLSQGAPPGIGPSPASISDFDPGSYGGAYSQMASMAVPTLSPVSTAQPVTPSPASMIDPVAAQQLSSTVAQSLAPSGPASLHPSSPLDAGGPGGRRASSGLMSGGLPGDPGMSAMAAPDLSMLKGSSSLFPEGAPPHIGPSPASMFSGPGGVDALMAGLHDVPEPRGTGYGPAIGAPDPMMMGGMTSIGPSPDMGPSRGMFDGMSREPHFGGAPATGMMDYAGMPMGSPAGASRDDRGVFNDMSRETHVGGASPTGMMDYALGPSPTMAAPLTPSTPAPTAGPAVYETSRSAPAPAAAPAPAPSAGPAIYETSRSPTPAPAPVPSVPTAAPAPAAPEPATFAPELAALQSVPSAIGPTDPGMLAMAGMPMDVPAVPTTAAMPGYDELPAVPTAPPQSPAQPAPAPPVPAPAPITQPAPAPAPPPVAPVPPPQVVKPTPPMPKPTPIPTLAKPAPDATPTVPTAQPMVPGIAPSAAQAIQDSGIVAPPGASLGYSPMGPGGVAAVYDNAPDYVKTAATGPGLFGAIDRDTGTGIGSWMEDRLAGMTAGHLTGGVGGAVGGMAGMAFGGPLGGMIGGMAGKFLGSRVGKSIPNSGLVGIPGAPAQGAISNALATGHDPGTAIMGGGGFSGAAGSGISAASGFGGGWGAGDTFGGGGNLGTPGSPHGPSRN